MSDNLQVGHYLKTYAEGNQQKVAITTIQNFEVFILNNSSDLCIQLYDLDGRIINDAEVKVRWKKLLFDENTKCYLDKGSNQKGLLEVTYKGFTAYYNLNRQYNNSFIRRASRKLVYGTPVKYVWIPVNFAFHVPVDGVKSAIDGWPRGTIYQIKDFFVKIYHRVACIFDDYHCNYFGQNYFEDKYTGYMVFNKPQYQPGDTVRFKAFIVSKKGKPINEAVDVVLRGPDKDIKLGELSPYRRGGYEYTFFLHDSLQLRLDRRYPVALRKRNDQTYMRSWFRYEDYELGKTKLSIRLDENNHYRNGHITLFAKGTDENNLNLQDARIEVAVRPKEVRKFYNSSVFIPDTLISFKKNLLPEGETEILIADSLFPAIDFDYIVDVKMLTSDNEVVNESRKASYWFRSKKFKATMDNDSLGFDYMENGKSLPIEVEINASDNFGNITSVYSGITPCKVIVNPYYASYTVVGDSLKRSVDISSRPSLISCYSERTNDSVFIMVDNPRGIPFNYNIYRRNRAVSDGRTDSLNFEKSTSSNQNYLVSLRYLWGGEVKEENYSIPLKEKELNISVSQPRLVYPGQRTNVEVMVSDTDGKPVENVDITAYGLTNKFNYSAPSLPYLGKTRKDKNVINSFKLKDFPEGYRFQKTLNYSVWNQLAGLDSLEYYRFLYPEDGIYQFEYPANDNLTQFSPFVVENGELKPVHVVYVDNRPVYFSWSTNQRPYSFRVDSGSHHIKLRTAEEVITMDSLYLNHGTKMVVSFDVENPHSLVNITEADKELSNFEQQILYKYIFPYRNNFGDKYAYIQNDGRLQLLRPEKVYSSYNLAGPVSGFVKFKKMDGFTTGFNHEPWFEYEFNPGLLKMRNVSKSRFPKHLSSESPVGKLGDQAITKSLIEENWQNHLNRKRYINARYWYPRSSPEGTGRLVINLNGKEEKSGEQPLNILVFRYDNPEFIRVYPGNTRNIHSLNEGQHQLIFFYPDARYYIEDSISIDVNGLNYQKILKPDSLRKDSFSVYVSDILEKTIFKPVPHYEEENTELTKIFSSYQQQFPYTGHGDRSEGYVYDEEGQPLPGVTVVVKGTNYGTVTDMDGHYTIRVPENRHFLTFSFIGFEQHEEIITSNGRIDVTLQPQMLKLEEVVVVGYGVSKKQTLTSSVSAVSTSSFNGGIPGVSGNIVQALKGNMDGLAFATGNSGSGMEIIIKGKAAYTFDQTPLYIINGKIYTGDISELDPSVVQNMQVLKGAKATAVYGSRAANGVVIIDTKPGGFKETRSGKYKKGIDYDEAFLEAASEASSVRSDFSDYAFWQPRLSTDEDGKASFEVTFPDDVTSWKTFYLAMNGDRQTGQTESLIKSYKPIMAQLAVPRFLLTSDTAFVIGKTLNYSLEDSVEVSTRFEQNDKTVYSETNYVTHALVDTLPIIGEGDSLRIKYVMEKKDGYFDGEQRDIPVYPLGLEATEGSFYSLDGDTSLQLSFNPGYGKVKLYARADLLEVMEEEIEHVLNYRYLCNEQMASKLKVLIAQMNIARFKGEDFQEERKVKRLISKLENSQKENGLWGWWKNSPASPWISLHVLEALLEAQKSGFPINFDKEKTTQRLIWDVENATDYFRKIRLLRILAALKAEVDFEYYIKNLEYNKTGNLSAQLQKMELKQQCGLKIDLDTLNSFRKTTMFGNVYYSDDSSVGLLDNDVQNTLMVYRILDKSSGNHSYVLKKIRNYFLEQRSGGYWRNTYESAQIVEAILPGLMKEESQPGLPVISIHGDVEKEVSEFPFEMTLSPEQEIDVSKTGDFPVYFTHYQKYLDESPKEKTTDFEITSSFDSKVPSVLKAGEKVTLTVNLEVKKDADYVMINVPIPAGCSYASKPNHFFNETHREYFKNEAAIFCEHLSEGNHIFNIELIPRYTGKYHLNPTKAELMYFPVFSGNNEIKKIEVK
ncbi:carboxypeptidase-like regulatory domain-containing protein [Marinilabilia rubra]|uniref:Alpha-2-macroglobulin domain-containing protein n=1 Tax=Marinilabilia rubra TaxID=2162893 RepID=A0A2U2B9K1_9BACT|nr:carboxypeptidase-like regulatory domain-containing protein [Marinilabilia rubra]PWD99748.1 hypothetical protein DDZ16_09910 [Marinilabilia rubra]